MSNTNDVDQSTHQAGPSAFQQLVDFHRSVIDDGENYAYFELAYTRRTDWMAWVTDRPGQGEAGSAEWEASRRVLARGQGDTPEEACQAALASINEFAGVAA